MKGQPSGTRVPIQTKRNRWACGSRYGLELLCACCRCCVHNEKGYVCTMYVAWAPNYRKRGSRDTRAIVDLVRSSTHTRMYNVYPPTLLACASTLSANYMSIHQCRKRLWLYIVLCLFCSRSLGLSGDLNSLCT